MITLVRCYKIIMFWSQISSMQSKSQPFISSSHLSIVSVENWMFVEVVHYYLLHMCNLHHYHLEALQIELSLDSHVHRKLLLILLKSHMIRFDFTYWTFLFNMCNYTYKTLPLHSWIDLCDVQLVQAFPAHDKACIVLPTTSATSGSILFWRDL